jgi:hypothetical protein
MKKQRYEIKNPDLESLSNELNEVIASGNYPESGYQNRKTYVITRNSLKGLVLKYFRRN